MANQAQRYKVPGEHEYDGVFYSSSIATEVLEKVKHNFQLRDDDVLLATYPKSGTTWFEEIIWLLMNNGDVATARKINQSTRVPYLEMSVGKGPHNIDILEKADSPRIIKSHLPFKFFSEQLTTKKTKVILGARNVKDTLVSYYHFYRMLESLGCFTGPFDEFFDLFRDKHLMDGDWFDYNLSYWNNRHGFNFHLLKYEDVHQDFYGTVKKLAEFLGKDLSEKQYDIIAKHVAFDEMKDNDKVNKSGNPKMHQKISPFLRKGKIGDWKNHFTDEQSEYVDKIYKEKIEGTGLEFVFEI